MDLTMFCEFKQISPTDYSSHAGEIAVEKVNNLLKAGWLLIETYKTCYDENFPDMQKLHYVLGYPSLNKTIDKITGESFANITKDVISRLNQDSTDQE
ncbi:MAG: hypothetical protein ACM3TR_10925 [Caulobacteraceae bacterium]